MPKLPRTEVSVPSNMAMMRPLQGDGWGAPGRATQALGRSIEKLGSGLSSMMDGLDAENEKRLEQQDALFLARERNALDMEELKHRSQPFTEDPNGYEQRREQEVYGPYRARVQQGVQSKKYRERMPLYLEGERGRLTEGAYRYGETKRQEKLYDDTLAGITNTDKTGEVDKLDVIIGQQGKGKPDEVIGQEFDAALPNTLAGINAMVSKYPGSRAQRDQILAYAAKQILARIHAVSKDGSLSSRLEKFEQEWMSMVRSLDSAQPGRQSQVPLAPEQKQKLAGVDPVVVRGLEELQGMVGRPLTVNSGYRSKEHNAAVGGASRSQHMHGNAIDIDVRGMSPDERVELIRQASALGFRGIGVYDNAIHLDIAHKRAWGPSYGADSVPSWARGVIAEHMQGKIPRAQLGGGAQNAVSLADTGAVQAMPDGRIDAPSMYARAAYKVANSPLNGQVPSWGPSVGITKGTPEEWARFFSMVTQAESGHRTAQRNPDGSLARFSSTPPTERSFGPGQFNVGEYGLKTWDDVNNPDRVLDAYIEVAKKGKFEAYFGKRTWQRIRNGELTRWFGEQVEGKGRELMASAQPSGGQAKPQSQPQGGRPVMIGFKGVDGAFDKEAFEETARKLGYEPVVVNSWREKDAVAEAQQILSRTKGNYAVYGFSLGAQSARDFAEAAGKRKPDEVITVGAHKDARLEFGDIKARHYFDRSGLTNPTRGEFIDAPHTGPGNIQRAVAKQAASGRLPGKAMALGAPGSKADDGKLPEAGAELGSGSVAGSAGPKLDGDGGQKSSSSLPGGPQAVQVAQAGGQQRPASTPYRPRTIEDELSEQIGPMKYNARLQDAAYIDQQINSWKSMAVEGKEPDPRVIDGLRKKIRAISMPELEQKLDNQLETARLIKAMRGASTQQLSSAINELRGAVARNGGVSNPVIEQRLDALETLQRKQTETLQRNPFEWATADGFPEQMPMRVEDLSPANLTDRKMNAEFVAGRYGLTEPKYFPFKEEKDAIVQQLRLGGDNAAKVLGNMREAFGKDMWKAVRELAPEAPEAARAGWLMAYGGDRDTVRDILAGIARRQDPNYKPVRQPQQSQVINNRVAEVIGNSLGTGINGLKETDALMRAVEAVIEARHPLKTDQELRPEMVEEALHGVLGGRVVEGKQYGGVIRQQTKAFAPSWFGGHAENNDVVLHNSIRKDVWRNAFEAITPEILAAAKVGVPIGADGKPINEIGIHISNGDARLRQLGYGRYAVQMKEANGQYRDLYEPDENGVPYRRFELDFEKLAPLLAAQHRHLINVGY